MNRLLDDFSQKMVSDKPPPPLSSGLWISFLSSLLIGCGAITNNFHQVSPSSEESPGVYRSAQLNPSTLAQVVEEKNIGMVINLRGKAHRKKWYKEESQVCQEKKIYHHSMKFSAYRAPKKLELLRLIYSFEQARIEKKNVLIHCQGGADRSSFGSALGKIILHGASVKEARKSFWWGYGHSCRDGNCPLELILKAYELDSNKMTFRQWTESVYRKEDFSPP